MSIQAAIILLLMGALQGVMFVSLLIQKKLYRNGYVFLLLYMSVLLLQLTFKLVSKFWLIDNLSTFYSVTHYLLLLSGPLAFLFTIALISPKKFRPVALLHFLPFLAISAIVVSAHSGIFPVVLIRFLLNPDIRLIMILASLSLYHIAALVLLKRNQPVGQLVHRPAYLLKWLTNLLRVSLVVCCLTGFALYLLYINYPNGYEYRYGFIGLSFFMYWISFSALKQPAVFFGIKGNDLPSDKQSPVLTIHRPVKKYSSSTLDETEKKRIREDLESLMKKEKLYLEAELTIDILTAKISCSRHALSQVLNEQIQQTFYNYVNSLRIEEAKRMLSAEKNKVYKISSIAYDAGFNSLSTFNEVFKKMTGQTPSGFRDEIHSLRQKQRI